MAPFHEAVLAVAGSKMLTTITRQVLAVTITHRSRYAYTEEQLNQAQIQHESIVNAIISGNYALAKWLMAEHVNKSSDLAMRNLSSSLP
jgi:DNA-binding GntR family transcriptional regulator